MGFLKFYFNYELSLGDPNACYLLPKRQSTGLTVQMVLKFNYFRDRNVIHVKKMLCGYQNQSKNLFSTEKLPAPKLKVNKACDEENLFTTTHNCEVKIFLRGSRGSVYSQNVGSTFAVKQLAEKSMKRAPKINISKNIKQRKENRRCIKDVDSMEAKVATTTVKKVTNTNS